MTKSRSSYAWYMIRWTRSRHQTEDTLYRVFNLKVDRILIRVIYLLRFTTWENGPNTTTKNYDLLETWRKETTRPSPENLKRWNIYSHEWKRAKNGRMEQSKAMEYESRKASSDVLKPRYIYIYIYIYITCYITQLTSIYSKCWKWYPFISIHLSTRFTMFLATFLSVLSFFNHFRNSTFYWRLPSKFFKETLSTLRVRHRL